MTRVDLQRLTKIYPGGDAPAVHQLSLTIPTGRVTALLGPSGCGKTTALKMVAGLIKPNEGDILFDGGSVLSAPPEKREAVMAFQHHLLFPHMSVGENIGFGCGRQWGFCLIKRAARHRMHQHKGDDRDDKKYEYQGQDASDQISGHGKSSH